MSEQVCSFCLGGSTEVPPFGDTKDAADLIKPCATCSIVTHRKCLLDWFNSLTSDKLHIVDGNSLQQELTRASVAQNRTNDYDHEFGIAPEVNHLHIDLTSTNVVNWLSNWTGTAGIDGHEVEDNNNFANGNGNTLTNNLFLLLAPCPQCKDDIMFSMRRSSLLSFNTGVRTVLSKGLQYTGVFLGLTSAVTGMLSMGYIGLTSCGLKIMDCILPEPLLIRLLTKKNSQNSLSLLSSVLLGNRSSDRASDPSIDNLETALSRGLIDPFKFSRIPILPIILYRMRQSSFIQCFFNTNDDKDLKISNWLTEFLINGYISSMGNHELARSVYENFLSSVTNILRNPRFFYKYLNIFKGINFWSTNNMISLLIPIRILYDMFFRITINQAHFGITMKVRPREIANSLPQADYDRLEQVQNSIENIRLIMKQQQLKFLKDEKILQHHQDFDIITWAKTKVSVIKKLLKENLVFKYFKLNALLAVLRLNSCIRYDYSKTLMYNSFTIRCLTTIMWPFVSSKFSKMFYNLLFKNMSDIPKEKLLFASNVTSLLFIVFIKDLVNLYLSYKKSKQLTQMKIINFDNLQSGSDTNTNTNFNTNAGSFNSLPGGFEL